MTQLGLFGGSFDPIHHGHLIVARSAAEQLGLARVVLIPSARPPHKLGRMVTDPAHRLAMVEAAIAGDPLFAVDDLELHRSGPSYTFDTVGEYRRRMGADAELIWFIGADSLLQLPSWYRVAELVQAVRIVTLTRAGWSPPEPARLDAAVGPVAARQLLRDCLTTPTIEISATDIRKRVRDGLPIINLVPASVRAYIDAHEMYQAG
ncbi:MAG: nicotinate (nicotinamide) nucleotide adenylyltransferase [Planctomycetes bacterium]|nr:nicotinate (nicotinamide) nucleotide adenylyltransferase [Planctomycetota bacterium]